MRCRNYASRNKVVAPIFTKSCLSEFCLFAEKEIDTRMEDEKQASLDDLPNHLKIGQDFTMRVTVLQAYGIASEYSDLFTQFK